MSKRKRDPTFTASEKMALVDLVASHYNIVECKKTDSVTVALKVNEWRKITDEFNAVSTIYPREATVLKNCWENLKKRAKQQQTLRNQHFLGTGGGPPKIFISEPAVNRVLELIQARISGHINPYDSDNTHIIASECDTDTQVTGENMICDDTTTLELDSGIIRGPIQNTVTNSTETATTLTVDWSQYTTNMLREAKNAVLCSELHSLPLIQTPSPHTNSEAIVCSQEGAEEINADDSKQGYHTPLRMHTVASKASTSRRRPNLRSEKETNSLSKERINILLEANKHASEEHELQMSILRLKEDQEKEILKQEKLKVQQEEIKLKILEIELKKLCD